jgi:hypothetical protein
LRCDPSCLLQHTFNHNVGQRLPLLGWLVFPPRGKKHIFRIHSIIRIHTNTNQLVTGYVQTALYAILIRAGDPKPAPGSPRFVRDRRRIHIFVIVVYLLYTVYEADYQLRLAGDFYQDLGVAHDVAERAVQSRFRRLYVALLSSSLYAC